MSGVYAYCLTPDLPEEGEGPAPDREGPRAGPGGVDGLGGAPVELAPWAGIRVWTSPASTRPRPDLDSVRRHHRVVDAAWRRSEACLPFRFGQWFGSRSGLDTSLDRRRAELLDALESVSGAVEYGVRIAPRDAPESRASDDREAERQPGPDPAPAAGPGRSYLESVGRRLRRQRERERDLEAVLDRLERTLATLVRRGRRVEAARPPAPGTSGGRAVGQGQDPEDAEHGAESGAAVLAHLVDRGDADAYLAAVEAAQREEPRHRFLISGPWPPYSFGP